ncbi:MAG: PAS domain S-box protein [Synechococcales bacterium]|nr:PAS domain S-box protein [Synechococcales bacterium]
MATDLSQNHRPFFAIGIGVSADRLAVLDVFLAQLATATPAAFVIVQHFSPDYQSPLAEVLLQNIGLPVCAVEDGMVLQPGRIHVSSPGQFLHLHGASLRITQPAPRFSGQFCPIDYFFQSLAQEWGDRAMAILLSDPEGDGSIGLTAIQRAGGLVLMQPPNPNMGAGCSPKSQESNGDNKSQPFNLAAERTAGTVVDGDSPPQAERDLHCSRTLREAIFSESTDAIFLVDAATYRVVDCNPRSMELFEANHPGELLNLDMRSLPKEPPTFEEMAGMQTAIEAQGVWEREVEYMTRKGHTFWGLLAAKRIQLAAQDLYLLRITDITPNKRATQILTNYNQALAAQISIRTAALKESEARFRAITDNLPGAIFQYVLHPDGTDQVLYVSKGCYDLWEFEAEVIQENAQLLWDTVHPDDVQPLSESILKSARTLQPWFHEWHIVTPSGQHKWLQGVGKPLRRENGDVAWDTVILDVSDRHRTEAALRETTARLERSQHIAHLGSWERDLVTHTVIWSSETRNIFGLPPDTEITYDLYIACVHPDDLERVRQAQDAAIADGLPLDIEYRIVRPDGEVRFLEEQGQVIFGANGQPLQISGSVLDITERKRVELALRESEAKLREAQRVAQIGTWEVDVITQQISWSIEIFHIFGRDRQSGAPLFEELQHLIHVDDRQEWQANLERAIATGDLGAHDSLRIVRPNGEVRYVEVKGETIINAQGQVVCLFGTVADITDRMRTEIALREQEAFFRSLFDRASVGIALCSLEGKLVRVNRTYCEILGREEGELLGQSCLEFVALSDQHECHRLLQQFATGEADYFAGERRFVRRDQSQSWVRVTASLVRDEAGLPITILAIVEDVNERKQAERALQVSEARFRTIFEHSPIGITITFPPEYKLAITNSAMQELLGYSAPELRELSYDQITLAVDLAAENQLVEECLAGDRNAYRMEKRFVRKDGEVIWGNLVTSVIRDAEGEIQFGIAMVEDITERKRAVDLEISRNRDLREAIFEESTDALFLVDGTTGLTVDCNQRAVELFEAASKDDLLNIRSATLQKLPRTPEEQAAILAKLHENGVWTDELEYCTLKGRAFWGRVSAKRLCIADTEMRLVQVTDVSDRKQVELDMRRNMEELQRLNQIKDDFLSTVSHELRTPLTSIDMAGRMLRIALEQHNLVSETDHPSTNKFLRYLRILREQTQQEGDLINDLLDLQRLNANAFALDLLEIDLSSWLSPILDSIRERAEQEQQVFQVAIAPYLPPFTTDPAVLRRILSELLNNACKYTPPQERIHLIVQPTSGPPTVQPAHPAPEIHQESNGEWQAGLSPQALAVLQIQILNTGVEISPADRERIFEPFYRAVKGDRWSKRGTGLGLSLVKKFVDCLGGTIQVSSSSNQTCFTIELPFRENF